MELRDRPMSFKASEPELPELPRCGQEELPPPDVFDPVIEAYKKDVDRTLLIENLRRSVADRLARFQSFMDAVGELRGAGLPPDVRERLLGR